MWFFPNFMRNGTANRRLGIRGDLKIAKDSLSTNEWGRIQRLILVDEYRLQRIRPDYRYRRLHFFLQKGSRDLAMVKRQLMERQNAQEKLNATR